MEKVYKMPGYDLHLIPTNKFKNITISLKLQNTLDEKTVAKRTLLSFMYRKISLNTRTFYIFRKHVWHEIRS